MKLLRKSKANEIYNILVSLGGAMEDDRDDFIYHHCLYKDGCREWRFCGKLGFGGKYRSTWNGATYYPEDETPIRKKLANEINSELAKLENIYI